MGASFYTDIFTRDAETWRRMLNAIETSLPTAPLAYDAQASPAPLLLEDPAVWCAAHLTGHRGTRISNGNANVQLMVAHIPPSAVLSECQLQELSIEFPDSPVYVERLPELVRAFGEAAGVIWGRASTTTTGAALASGVGRVSSGPNFLRQSPPVVIPGCLDWVSWWSDASCHALGFTLDDPRTSLFARVTAVPGHGVVVQLTDESLDLGHPEHLAAVTAAYRAFPEIDQKWGI